jgi:hypothetical protein
MEVQRGMAGVALERVAQDGVDLGLVSRCQQQRHEALMQVGLLRLEFDGPPGGCECLLRALLLQKVAQAEVHATALDLALYCLA